MTEITNVKIYDLKESVIACRNAMRTEPAEYTEEEFEAALQRAIKLAQLGGGSGHSNFRKGIRVSFDIKYPNYLSPELQRYGFLDIVCSSSKMHRLTSMNMDECFNEYVTEDNKSMMKNLIQIYNRDKSYENFMRVISNCPLGVELFMRCSTNYEQLSTIYKQRKHHRLQQDWGTVCRFIESLPYSQQLITIEK